jgi:pimeloyl-ACP methyl ester carboxylesterase
MPLIMLAFLALTNLAFGDTEAGISCMTGKVLERPNLLELCQWQTPEGSSRQLYLERMAPGAAQLRLRQTLGEESKDITLLSDGDFSIVKGTNTQGEPIFKVQRLSETTGHRLELVISSEEQWPSGFIWINDRLSKPDPERQVLKVVSEEGHHFLSYFYPAKNIATTPRLAVIFKSGLKPFSAHIDANDFLETVVVSYLRENGYAVLLANHRGKTGFSNAFRTAGIGHLGDNAIGDIKRTLEIVQKHGEFKQQNIHLIGHGRGAQLATFVSTSPEILSPEFKVTKTIAVSGIYNPFEGHYNYFEGLSFPLDEKNSLDFRDAEWLAGVPCVRPEFRFTDDQWAQLQTLTSNFYSLYFKTHFSEPQTLCQSERFKNSETLTRAPQLSGKFLALQAQGDRGIFSPHGPALFQGQAPAGNVKVVVHSYGHAFPPSITTEPATGEAVEFLKKQLGDFLKN